MDQSRFSGYADCRFDKSSSGASYNSHDEFAGIPATRSETGSLLKLENTPEPIVRIGLVLSGALFGDSIYLDKASIQLVAAPMLGKIAKMLNEFGLGATYSVLRISEVDSEILVLGSSVRSKSERAMFTTEFSNEIGRAFNEVKVIAKLAGMPAEKFSQAWFSGKNIPDQAFLPALRAVLDLNRLLIKYGASLTIDGQVVALPDCSMLKTTKHAGVVSGVVGELAAIQSRPGIIALQMNGSAKTISLRATGNGYVDQLNREFTVGEAVRVSYEPVLDLLRPFEIIPSKGRLLSIERA